MTRDALLGIKHMAAREALLGIKRMAAWTHCCE